MDRSGISYPALESARSFVPSVLLPSLSLSLCISLDEPYEARPHLSVILPSQLCSTTPWIKAFHQGQEKKATAIALVTASEPADGTVLSKDRWMRCGNRNVVGYGLWRRTAVGGGGRGNCLERRTVEGESPAPRPLRSHHRGARSTMLRVWLFGIAASRGQVNLCQASR